MIIRIRIGQLVALVLVANSRIVSGWYLDSFHGESRFQTWLYRIAANKARDFHEKRWAAKRGGRQTPVSLQADDPATGLVPDPPSGMSGPDEFLMDAEQMAVVRQSLDRLGEPCHEIIALRYFGDLSYEELSATLRLNPNSSPWRADLQARGFSNCLKAPLRRPPVPLNSKFQPGHRLAKPGTNPRPSTLVSLPKIPAERRSQNRKSPVPNSTKGNRQYQPELVPGLPVQLPNNAKLGSVSLAANPAPATPPPAAVLAAAFAGRLATIQEPFYRNSAAQENSAQFVFNSAAARIQTGTEAHQGFSNNVSPAVPAAAILANFQVQPSGATGPLRPTAGPPPLLLYRELIALKLDWRKVTTFNLHEYIGLPREHPQSYHSFMWENLFLHVNISRRNVHILDGLAKDISVFCERCPRSR